MIYRISYEKSNIQFWFFKKDPQYRNKREIFSLKIYKKPATNIPVTAETFMLSPLRSAIRKECLVSPFNLVMCLLVIWDVNVTSGFGTWKCESRFVLEDPLTCPLEGPKTHHSPLLQGIKL